MSGLRTEKADLGAAALALVALSVVVCAADWAAARGGGARARRLRGVSAAPAASGGFEGAIGGVFSGIARRFSRFAFQVRLRV